MATFDERAKEWDTPERAERAGVVAAAVRAVVPLGPSMRAIEIGAGTGLLGLHFAGDLASLLLTDPSTGMLEVAAETGSSVAAVRKQLERGRAAMAALLGDTDAEPPQARTVRLWPTD